MEYLVLCFNFVHSPVPLVSRLVPQSVFGVAMVYLKHIKHFLKTKKGGGWRVGAVHGADVGLIKLPHKGWNSRQFNPNSGPSWKGWCDRSAGRAVLGRNLHIWIWPKFGIHTSTFQINISQNGPRFDPVHPGHPHLLPHVLFLPGRNLAYGIWHLAPDTSYLTPGIWHLLPDTWHLTPATWHLASDTCHLLRFNGHCPSLN